MQQLLILGAGTAGTTVANRLRSVLASDEWRIRLVDQDDFHLYQPGLLFIPFGTYSEKDVVRSRHSSIDEGIDFTIAPIDRIDTEQNRVLLANGGAPLSYDALIIATGAVIRPDEIPGMLEEEWRKSIFDFYTLDGAVALHEKLEAWTGGRLVVNIAEMPIKCPVAPLEFLFLADAYFQKRGMRDQVELVLATPLSGAFTKPIAAQQLGETLSSKGIQVEADFAIERVDGDKKRIVSYDEREVDFDLLVTIPPNMGSEVIERSELGDDLHFVPTQRETLQAKAHTNIFVLGDATDLPTSKAGSVAHFQVDGFVENFQRWIDGLDLLPLFDGHANCFVESGHGKGFLIDFNYDVEPLPGTYPLPGVGPFRLLEESRINHWGKMAFRWVYWNLLLKGRPLPVPTRMSMVGKRVVS